MSALCLRDDEEQDDECTAVASRAELNAALAAKAKQRPCLIIASGGSTIGKMFRLDQEITVGRSESATVRLDQEGVSRLHAKFVVTPEGGVDLLDLNSRNGTFVNGESVSRIALRDGDKIQIGTATILKFSYQDALDEALQQNLYDSATKDALTNLANKRTFSETILKEFAFAKRQRRPLALISFDLDRFKRINDTYGHPAGDFVLQKLAKVLTEALRVEDLAARVGGEEFAILLRDASEAKAMECAERIRRTVEATEFVYEQTRIPVTVSMGVVALSHEVAAEQLIVTADKRLYAAKEGGRNRVVGGTVLQLVGS
jgi:two-component system cell cycle response regulator